MEKMRNFAKRKEFAQKNNSGIVYLPKIWPKNVRFLPKTNLGYSNHAQFYSSQKPSLTEFESPGTTQTKIAFNRVKDVTRIIIV